MSEVETSTHPSTVKENCPTCDGERSCDVHGHHYVPWNWEDKQEKHHMNGGVDHSLLQCRGCETVFYLHDSWNDEDIDHWYDDQGQTQSEPVRTKVTHPKPNVVNKPLWIEQIGKIDLQIKNILDETYSSYSNGSYFFTAIGLRTALDRGTELLGIDTAKTFAEKLRELKDGGWIGETEHQILKVVTDAGSAAAHRGWSPDSQDAAHLLYAMEVFLQRAFIAGEKALAVKDSIPARPKYSHLRKSHEAKDLK